MSNHEPRFGKLWESWDAHLRAGDPPEAFLREAKDEDLVEILAGESELDRKYARDVIATELLNRLHVRATTQPATARAAADSADAAHESAKDGADAIHRAEGILKASGEWDVGATVSASAYESLDATKAASDSAREHAASFQRHLDQSRLGAELSKDAAVKASESHDKTRAVQGRMERLGKGEEGRAASKASLEIKKAAEEAAKEATSRDESTRRGQQG